MESSGSQNKPAWVGSGSAVDCGLGNKGCKAKHDWFVLAGCQRSGAAPGLRLLLLVPCWCHWPSLLVGSSEALQCIPILTRLSQTGFHPQHPQPLAALACHSPSLLSLHHKVKYIEVVCCQESNRVFPIYEIDFISFFAEVCFYLIQTQQEHAYPAGRRWMERGAVGLVEYPYHCAPVVFPRAIIFFLKIFYLNA